jgi:putative ABC transport system substrate-binding protein
MLDDARRLPRAPLTAFWLADPWTPERPRRVVDLRLHPPHHRGMDRRRFLLTSLAGALAAPLAAEAQQADRTPRIGWLTSSVVHVPNVEAFRAGMHALGYPEVRLEVRAAAGRVERLPALAAELLALNVNVIVTDGGRQRPRRSRSRQQLRS